MKKKLIAIIMLTTMCVPFVACSTKATNEVEKNEGITIEEGNVTKNEENEVALANVTEEESNTNGSEGGTNTKSESSQAVNLDNNKEEVEAASYENSSNVSNNKTEVSKPNIEINKPSTSKPGNNSNNETNKPLAPPTSGTVDSSYLAEVENAIFNATNAERAKAGLLAFKRNSTANQYARSKSKDMLDNNYFDHYSPSKGMISDIAKRDGWKYSRLGENIYTSTGMNPDGQAITNSWMNSQGHRENILNSGFTEIGIGVTYKNGKLYATQIFYTP